MLKTIFHQGEPSSLPGLCAVGECLDPNTSYCDDCRPSGEHPPTSWWATGILIHPRAVLTVAHSPRSTTILGDRILLPAIDCEPGRAIPKPAHKGGKSTPCCQEHILCVQRIHDHPRAPQRGCDARLLILMESPKIKHELLRRRCRLEEYNPDRMADFHIDGFMNLPQSGPKNPLATRSRQAKTARDAHNQMTHGHLLGHEFVITPDALRSPGEANDRTAAFGDSGAPVWIDAPNSEGGPLVVGMYVRRSLNRPAMTNPDLVVLEWNAILKDWVEDVLDRYNLRLDA